MGYIKLPTFTFLLIFILGIHKIYADNVSTEIPTVTSPTVSNPLGSVADKNVIENITNSNRLADEVLSRVRRQYDYDPYYRRRYPIPILTGGGFGVGPGVGGFGGRGYGGRGFGGRGFGGRGSGGRGFGGRGIGGRGIGGRGGGGFGGGRGGRG